MKTMLTAKHWQVFLLVFGIDLIYKISGEFSEDIYEISLVLRPIVSFSIGVLFFGWLWPAGIGISKRTPVENRGNSSMFKIALLIVFSYLLFVTAYLQFNGLPDHVWFYPAHILFLFSCIYSLAFVAKSIRSFELNVSAPLGMYLGEFFLLFFFPLGVWVIQPRVNKIFHSSSNRA